ncbi:MAG: putative HMP/thiamine import ATP-binding protein YkoD [Firmicutes bacterium ADurb.Bin193]|nr:MAG: putative HMP/thiamine import ATP-binding protein YkoD [Firmicutes bacterium ADurb.Bin193]
MACYKIGHLSFRYPNRESCALADINLTIEQGQFVTICGKSGCGKTTLLRQLKPSLAPFGVKEGEIFFEGQPIGQLGQRQASAKIGFVLQSPDNQIVTDKVWHELAFGLESLGFATAEIRTRVAEMASFFGIQAWFHKKVTELSGGQKQLLNLASIMVMQPSVLILDEPTSQLDPIAALDFLETLRKINRELGTTILLTEHRLEEAFAMSDRVIVMDEGRIIADGAPAAVGEQLKALEHDMFVALPAPMRIFAAVETDLACPVTVREGRKWLEQLANVGKIDASRIPAERKNPPAKLSIELKDVWFRYEKDLPDVVKGLSAQIYAGELFAMVGGNGTGKTTSLSVMGGLLTPYRGCVRIDGRALSDVREKYNGLIGVLPQNPQALFVKKTLELDLYEVLKDSKLSRDEQTGLVAEAAALCELDGLLSQHPYDLSGGEQQRAALAKVLLLKPGILLLDEPTKGLDAYFKEKLASILSALCKQGVTIVMVSHDIEFCAKHADRCAMFFDGSIVSTDTAAGFFSGKSFYTTAANRMARTILPEAVLAEDVIAACGGKLRGPKEDIPHIKKLRDVGTSGPENSSAKQVRLTKKRIASGSIFAGLFIVTANLFSGKWTGWREYLVQFVLALALAFSLASFIPGRPLGSTDLMGQTLREKRRLSKRTLVAAIMILLIIPLTIYAGIAFFGDRKYYFISLLIVLEILLPFALIFESRRPQAREIVVIAVLCVLATAGRTAFFMLPQFKPVVALVIIAGVCFGGETGFLVGAVTGFVSNMFFGQGPWTPWQIFAFGIIGFLAGILFSKGYLSKTRSALCIFGGLSTFLIYGGIMNPAAVIMWQAKPTFDMFVLAYLMGIPFDMIHAASTVLFLWFISQPLIEKLDRIKIKYGIIR